MLVRSNLPIENCRRFCRHAAGVAEKRLRAEFRVLLEIQEAFFLVIELVLFILLTLLRLGEKKKS